MVHKAIWNYDNYKNITEKQKENVWWKKWRWKIEWRKIRHWFNVDLISALMSPYFAVLGILPFKNRSDFFSLFQIDSRKTNNICLNRLLKGFGRVLWVFPVVLIFLLFLCGISYCWKFEANIKNSNRCIEKTMRGKNFGISKLPRSLIRL